MMNDEKPPSNKASWLNRLAQILSQTPESREQLEEVLHKSHRSSVIDDDALQIMEGALHMGEQQARDIMIPRSQVQSINSNASLSELLEHIVETGHSRFPIEGESLDDILGILLAKDLIPLLASGQKDIDLTSILRPATIIPESKRLSVLLREFREQRYHMAIVIDEYGSVAGLLTIEDILEEIVGEIEDETDEEEASSIDRQDNGTYLVQAHTEIDDFNQRFQSDFSEKDYDTIGGLITSQLGHLPKAGESIELEGFTFNIIEADNRRILVLQILPDKPLS